MSESMIIGIKHAHTFLVVVFVVHYLFKSFLLLSNKTESLDKYSAKMKLVDMIVPLLFIVTGIIMLLHIGMANIGGWFHLKLALIVVAIPAGIIGMKKRSKALTIITSLIFIYLLILAFVKNPLLFF